MHSESITRNRIATALAAAILLMIATLCGSASQAQRLPQTVTPTNYTLELTPDLKAAKFTGRETIDVTLKEPLDHITLNAIEIHFDSVTAQVNGKTLAATVTLDNAKQQATFAFAEKIPSGKAALKVAYTGILNNQLRGFYLSKTAQRNYAVTQFESTDARRAFPCFDEPAFKATYDVTLIVDAADSAISNSPIASDVLGPVDGKHTIHFEPTPKMSTYLVAFLVGDFLCTSGSADGVAIRVCSTPDKIALTSYGVGVAEYVLKYYNKYFDIPYPLAKLDLIALPDFEAGAMENFGAITYRETELLVDEKSASNEVKKRVNQVIAHEMAHQWFGDLVTMQWWDNIWLNEGFADWLENKPVAAQHPEWNMDQEVIQEVENTLNLDTQAKTHAIRAKADTPDEINEMFDGISYGKGGNVLLMVENYLGKETFRLGVHNYLAAHLYGNATAEDFWNTQATTGHKPVDRIMDSLVAQPGAPLLTFGEPQNGKVSVAQRRFFVSPSIQPDPSQKWTVPVCFRTTSDKPDCSVLTPDQNSLPTPQSNLFFANAGGTGYYRTAYTPAVYNQLLAHVEDLLKPVERIRLVGDEWAQVRANKASVGDFLNLVNAISADSNASVITSALGSVRAIDERIATKPGDHAALAVWVVKHFAPQYEHLAPSAASDSVNLRQLRAALFVALGHYGTNPDVLNQARLLTNKYLDNPASVDPTLAKAAAAIAARNGDAALFDKLQSVYETSANPEQQEMALHLMVGFRDPVLLKRALDYAVSGKVRNQDVAIEFAIALRTPESQSIAWKFIQANWDKVQAQLTTTMGNILVSSTGSFCSASDREDVKRFFAAHKVAASERALTLAVNSIDGCIELRSLQEPKLNKWLAEVANK